MNTPQSDIAEIKRQLRSVSQEVAAISSSQTTIINRLDGLEGGLEDRIELALRRRMDHQGRTGREVSNWVISIVSFGLFVVFGLVTIAFQIWGS